MTDAKGRTPVVSYLALVLLCLALYLPGLAAVPPLDRDESRFAQATRQMLETGDFIRIQFQDTPRNKKPVGIHWMQAASVAVFGSPDRPAIWPYRLPSVLGATAAVLFTFHFGQALFNRRTAFLGAALLAGSLMLTTEAHQAKTDAVLLACVVAAQGALARLYTVSGRFPETCPQSPGGLRPWLSAVVPKARLRRDQRRPASGLGTPEISGVPYYLRDRPSLAVALTFWLAQGIGVLVKGPMVPLISLLTIAALWIWDRRLGWLGALRPLVGLPLAAAVVAPWLVAISAATGGAFVGDAVKSDLLPKLLGAQESHGAPPGYYLLLVTLTLWPASLFLWPALIRSWRERSSPAVRFCLAWTLPTWVLFEVVPTKLPHYVLPAYPALTLLIAAAVSSCHPLMGSRWGKGYSVAWAALGVVLAVAFVVLPMKYGTGLAVGSVVAAVGALAAALLPLSPLWRGRSERSAALALGGAAVAYVGAFAVVLPSIDAAWLSLRVAEQVERISPGRTAAVAAAGYHEPSLVFLLGTGTRLVGGTGAAAHLLANPAALAVITRSEEAPFQAHMKENGRTALAVATVPGFNYSRGKAETLTVYSSAP